MYWQYVATTRGVEPSVSSTRGVFSTYGPTTLMRSDDREDDREVIPSSLSPSPSNLHGGDSLNRPPFSNRGDIMGGGGCVRISSRMPSSPSPCARAVNRQLFPYGVRGDLRELPITISCSESSDGDSEFYALLDGVEAEYNKSKGEVIKQELQSIIAALKEEAMIFAKEEKEVETLRAQAYKEQHHALRQLIEHEVNRRVHLQIARSSQKEVAYDLCQKRKLEARQAANKRQKIANAQAARARDLKREITRKRIADVRMANVELRQLRAAVRPWVRYRYREPTLYGGEKIYWA